MTKQELEEILAKHKLWLTGDSAGVRANLTSADLRDANLRGADLEGANLRGAKLASADLTSANLRYADLLGANLTSADLEGARLRGAKLTSANLRYADFLGADLTSADLEVANLTRTNLTRTNLTSANLRGANLRNANLWNADLTSADLEGARLKSAGASASLLCLGNMREIRTVQIDTWRIGYTADTLQIGCQTHPIDKWRKWDSPAGRKWIESMDGKALEWADRNLALVLALIDANPATPTGHERKTDD